MWLSYKPFVGQNRPESAFQVSIVPEIGTLLH